MKENRRVKVVIISGATGYFGSAACQYFRSWGWQVLKATRHSDADIQLNLDRPEEFAQQKISIQADLFIHAAAANEIMCREQPYHSIFINVAGTKAALDFCVSNSIPNFVYVSTFHVFGHLTSRIDEFTQPSPVNDYGLSHLYAEQYVQSYTRLNKIKGMVVRPSNLFGIPVSLQNFNRWTLAPLAFCKEAIETGKIVLHTPGFQKRNFISIEDVCAVIHTTFSRIAEFPLLHLAGSDTLQIRDLAYLVQKIIYKVYESHIDLIIPEGAPNKANFTYASCFLNDLYQPRQRIEDFIFDFCKMLGQ